MKRGTRQSLLLALAGLGLYAGIRMMTGTNRYDLRGRVVVITGGSRGLGLALARELAKRDARLAICSRSLTQLESARQELAAAGAEVLALACDVTDRSEVQRLIDTVINHYGKIDVLINNAGIIQVGPMEVMSEKEFQEAINIHFWAPLYTILETLPHFRARHEGRVINISSIGGKVAVPHLLPYCASKFALVGLSEGLAAELKKENIIVSTIAPGLMRTGSPRNITVKGDHQKEYAWFKTAASMPILASDVNIVAERIIDGLESNRTRPSVSLLERLASISSEIAPEGIDLLMAQMNRMLPGRGINGFESRKGFESESAASLTKIARNADADALMNNEI